MAYEADLRANEAGAAASAPPRVGCAERHALRSSVYVLAGALCALPLAGLCACLEFVPVWIGLGQLRAPVAPGTPAPFDWSLAAHVEPIGLGMALLLLPVGLLMLALVRP